VELIAVIVILAMLAGLVAFKTRSYLVTSKQNAARVEIRKICEALETYYAAHDRYPTSDEGLEALANGSDRMPDGILDKVPLDPWRHSYQYTQPGAAGPYDIICLGADGREGGTAADQDIANFDIAAADSQAIR
jgi:general secretion pathway protein G